MATKSKYFSAAELQCPCCGQCNMNQKILDIADTIRFGLNKPLTITSGYRCAKHNDAVGGAKDSQHLIGCAIDLKSNLEVDRFYIVSLALRNGARGIEVCDTHVHVDIRQGDPVFICQQDSAQTH